jgi:flavin reductase (DIM6/NTAB) family NADH-FMN oxidoreductase RutF
MRKNFGPKPQVYPQPVFIIGTYNSDGTPNAMSAAWGGITEEAEITICVGDNHKTTENIVRLGDFTVSVGTADTVVACDYVGIASGNDVPNKIEKIGWHSFKSEFVNAPLFEELPMALECRVISYDKESCRLIGEIVNVSADECVLNADGKVDPAKLRPITYDSMNHNYLVLGEKVGNAFEDGLTV